MRAGLLLLFIAGTGLVVLSLLVPPRRRARGAKAGPARQALDDAGLEWPSSVLGAACASAALVAAALSQALTGLTAAAALAAVAAFPLPLLWVLRRGAARRQAVIDSWPDAIDALLAAVRSGDSLPGALATAAASGPEPLRPALAAASEAARATGDFGGAMRALGVSLGDPITGQVAAALVLAHEVGGRELGQVLRDLAAFVRAERALRRELQARQSWTVNAARVAAAGPWVVLLFLALRGDTRAAFAGAGGTVLLVIGALLSAVGYRLMVVIGRLPVAAGGLR